METNNFSIIFSNVSHPYERAIIELRFKKEFMSIRCLGMLIKRVTLVNKYVFRLGFLHKSETYSWKVGRCSNLTFKRFSNLLFSMLVLSAFRFTFSVLLARKWYLLALLFRTFFQTIEIKKLRILLGIP